MIHAPIISCFHPESIYVAYSSNFNCDGSAEILTITVIISSNWPLQKISEQFQFLLGVKIAARETEKNFRVTNRSIIWYVMVVLEWSIQGKGS